MSHPECIWMGTRGSNRPPNWPTMRIIPKAASQLMKRKPARHCTEALGRPRLTFQRRTGSQSGSNPSTCRSAVNPDHTVQSASARRRGPMRSPSARWGFKAAKNLRYLSPNPATGLSCGLLHASPPRNTHASSKVMSEAGQELNRLR